MSKEFVPGITPIKTGGVTVGPEEKAAMIETIEAGWVAGGMKTEIFEMKLAKYTGHKFALSCNSGSSANLIAVATMVEKGLWKKGDEILCVAASFPTTVNPLLLYGLVPVFVDISLPTFQVNMDEFEAAITDKTKGVMIAHTMGNPFDIDRMYELAEKHRLTVVEDCCDALGSFYKGQHVGMRAHIATTSFYPAHHISTGEGGAVFMNSKNLFVTARSMRDWGRSCYCAGGQENACGARFEQKLGALPDGFDHKYTYQTLGFNLKMAEIPAAMGIAQLAKIDQFTMTRIANFRLLSHMVAEEGLLEHFSIAEATPGAAPSWFGFPIVLKKTGLRRELQIFLDQRKIATRLVFGGNLLRQPYMLRLADQKPGSFRPASAFAVTDKLMHDALWLGVYPDLTPDMLAYVVQSLKEFFDQNKE